MQEFGREEFTLIENLRKCISNDKVCFPPLAATVNQLNMNYLLYHITSAALKDDITKSGIGS